MLKKTFISSPLIVLLIALSGGLTQAGIIDNVLFSGPSGDYRYEFDVVNLELTLYETLYEPGSLQIDISGDTPTGSIFQVSKQIENTTGVTWTAYELTVSGGTFTGTASSNKFPDIAATFDNIVFSGGTVENNQTVELEFEIDVPFTATGLNFSMTQTAIPEPATIALLGLGALSLLRRKRKA